MPPLLPSAQRRTAIIKLLKSIIPLDLNFIAVHCQYHYSVEYEGIKMDCG